jgi:purine-binding chemotaxis protein CheW
METHYASRNHAPEKTEVSRKFVTFMIGSETYGVEALKVQEIIGMMKITEIPNSYTYLKGVINLRGIVVPVVDMRLKFGMEGKDYDFFTVIIIIEVKNCPVGMIVDTVSDVIDLREEDIKDSRNFSVSVRSDFISGIGNHSDALIIILDTDKVMSSAELSAMEMATSD